MPREWAVGRLDYINAISEPTGGENRFSGKIIVLCMKNCLLAVNTSMATMRIIEVMFDKFGTCRVRI